MLKDWVAGGNCASWPRKKGGKRAATKIPSILLMDRDWKGSLMINKIIIIIIVKVGLVFDNKIFI